MLENLLQTSTDTGHLELVAALTGLNRWRAVFLTDPT